jgi:hypothetical protein
MVAIGALQLRNIWIEYYLCYGWDISFLIWVPRMEIVPRIIRVKLPYIGGEGGPHHLNRKNQPCVLNSFFEDPLESVIFSACSLS